MMKRIPFYLPLLAVFFCLHGVAENFGYISSGEAVITGLKIATGLLIFAAIIYLFSRNILYSCLICFFIEVWYLFFGAIQHLVRNSFLHAYSVLIPVLLTFTLAVILLFRKKPVLREKWTTYLNVLLLLYCAYDSVNLFLKNGKYKPENSALIIDTTAVTARPDVYLLLFDEYPGYKSLAEKFGFKNDILYNSLQGMGYKEMPVFANYSVTPYSMSSILNMKYIKAAADSGNAMQTDLQKRSGEIRHATVFEGFQQMGYRINNFSIFDVADQRSSGGSSFILGHDRLLTDKIFHNRFIKDFGWMFATGRFSNPFTRKLYFGDLEEYNETVSNKLHTSLSQKKSRPVFTYAHFLMPHQPYAFDSTGKKNETIGLEDAATLSNKPLFLSYLKYCNRKIIAYANEIVKKDPGALVIILSDHGFRYYKESDDAKLSKYNNFCFIRYAAKTPVPYTTGFSNVNLMKYIFNEDFGQKLPYAADSIAIITTEEKE